MSSFYTVGVNESIRDVVTNSTGSILGSPTFSGNWDAILTANSFDTWTPLLVAGQQILIPDTVVIDTNTLNQMETYPSNQGTTSGYYAILQAIWNLLDDRWILKTGFWDDTGIWIDEDTWIDSL